MSVMLDNTKDYIDNPYFITLNKPSGSEHNGKNNR